MENTSNAMWKRLNYHVQNAVRYHVRILSIVKEAQVIFHLPLLLMFAITLYLLCLQVYRASSLPISDVRVVVIVIEAATAFFPILMVCYYGEELGFNSQEVGNAAYQLDFVGTDTRFQKSLIMIIRQSQSTNRIKAGGMIELSMETTVWMLQAAFSAYMMLRTINAP
ncbi:hypothetical protein RI129_009517 [Pyrocoelia pectoralis]|uniref:Uncharacterized protein n=1 Tax=Pyrocoelia pectoralis TaxID=417401 RepID=A0AAN7ZCB1_9COLE